MAEPIEQLRIYKQARAVEDEIYELVKTFPADQFYGLGNDLRPSSAAVSHHIWKLTGSLATASRLTRRPPCGAR
jgi:hypothetical protein